MGGTDGARSLASSEIFDPVSGTVSAGPSLLQARAGHISATVMDHRVVVAGGTNGSTDLASAEFYSESSSQFLPLNASLTIPRQDAFAILIPGSGLVLIAGGEGGGQALSDTELFDPGIFTDDQLNEVFRQQIREWDSYFDFGLIGTHFALN